MKTTSIGILMLLVSIYSYGQEYKEVEKSGVYNFQINVIRYIHAPRGVGEERIALSANTTAECSYIINGAFSENQAINKGQKAHALGAIQVEMQYQFFEFLMENYPSEMDKLKNLGYKILCQVIDNPEDKAVFRKYTPSSMRAVKMLKMDTIPTTPVPEYDVKKLLFIDDFVYDADCITNENSRTGDVMVTKHFHTKDHKVVMQAMSEFSKMNTAYFRQENWKTNSHRSRGN